MGAYATAGNPYVTADGLSFQNDAPPATYQMFMANNGNDVTRASQAWAETNNQYMIAEGRAILTANGVLSMDTILTQLQQHGYMGSTDPASVVQAFNLLHTAAPAIPTPTVQGGGGGSSLGGLSALTQGNTPLLIGGAVLLFLVLGKGRL